METHYEILNVSENASHEQIKARFQQLILLHHPDRNGGSPNDKQAQRILEAWEVLRDPAQRKQYDAELSARQAAVSNGEVDLDDMIYDEDAQSFSLRCRCSGAYTITENELEQGIDTVCCDNCSLQIHVLYDVVEEEEPIQSKS
ncbi:DnaJ-domain-containing protein [Lichtheimia hyalospora FSU 10163]|nr:DnaJ-domain-containing protein [Lichtheimia hyalospora FSU 10163]